MDGEMKVATAAVASASCFTCPGGAGQDVRVAVCAEAAQAAEAEGRPLALLFDSVAAGRASGGGGLGRIPHCSQPV